VPPPAPVSPDVFKAIILKLGYEVQRETEDNWTLFKGNSHKPILVIPRKGPIISLTIMMDILGALNISDAQFFELRDEVRS